MLPVSRCRKLLGPECQLSDGEVEELLLQLDALAVALFDQLAPAVTKVESETPQPRGRTKKRKVTSTRRGKKKLVRKSTNEDFEERAAIREFDGGLSRRNAERAARRDGLRLVKGGKPCGR